MLALPFGQNLVSICRQAPPLYLIIFIYKTFPGFHWCYQNPHAQDYIASEKQPLVSLYHQESSLNKSFHSKGVYFSLLLMYVPKPWAAGALRKVLSKRETFPRKLVLWQLFINKISMTPFARRYTNEKSPLKRLYLHQLMKGSTFQTNNFPFQRSQLFLCFSLQCSLKAAGAP